MNPLRIKCVGSIVLVVIIGVMTVLFQYNYRSDRNGPFNTFELGDQTLSEVRGWACDDCTVGYVSVASAMTNGGLECEHGPEHDRDDCDLTKSNWGEQCWEENGNQANPDDPNPNAGDGLCKCYECGVATNCENEIQIYMAWCGPETPTNCGECETHADPATDFVIKRVRNVVITEGAACNYGQNGYERQNYCGGNGGGAAFTCVSDNCAPDTTDPWRETKVNYKWDCGPA